MFIRLIKICLVAFAVLSGSAQAASQATTDYTYTEIISEKTGFTPGETAWFAVRQELRENWHVFWVNPGDAGIPLSFNWTLPDGWVCAWRHPASGP
ncbi:MAG: hypothetical protein GXP04_05975 [Alphaproteobacteria bacterium]|nr:hypothetical protein [Alphaproteobacteria bacterium]